MSKQIDERSKRKLVREFFKPNNITQYSFMEDTYSRWDFEYRNRAMDKLMIGELKERNCYSTTYPDTLLDRSKFEAVRNEAKQRRLDLEGTRMGKITRLVIPVYIAMFKDCMYIFNLDDVAYKEDNKHCPATTSFSNRNMVNKSVVLLDFKDGVRVEYGKNARNK